MGRGILKYRFLKGSTLPKGNKFESKSINEVLENAKNQLLEGDRIEIEGNDKPKKHRGLKAEFDRIFVCVDCGCVKKMVKRGNHERLEFTPGGNYGKNECEYSKSINLKRESGECEKGKL